MFFTALAARERDDRFCISCHLHETKFDRLNAAAPTDLAGYHHVRRNDIGCIACHGGADAGMRLRVWVLAGFDTLRYLVGAYHEPTRMQLPLRDADCRHCHTPILSARAPARRADRAPDPADEATYEHETETEGYGGTSYHALREHDSVNVRCVRCHTSHTTDGPSSNRFISADRTRTICRECHRQM